MSSPALPQLQCSQSLGVFQQHLAKIQQVVSTIDTRKCIHVGKYIVLGENSGVDFPGSGCAKKVNYCVVINQALNEFTVHLALRSPVYCIQFAREKRAFTLLEGVNGVLQPLLIKTLGRFEYMITDLYNEGCLFDFIVHKVPSLKEHTVQMISYSLISAMLECHRRGVIHRDIKPENILVRQLEDGRYDVSIIDFGMAFFMEDGCETEARRACGSPDYISNPDWIEMEETGVVLPADYGRDNYALGFVLYALATRTLPGKLVPSPTGNGSRYDFDAVNTNLGLLDEAIKALVYECRTKMPPLGLIQQKMHAIMLKEYPHLEEVKQLTIGESPRSTPKWKREQMAFDEFVETASKTKSSSGSVTILEIVQDYLQEFLKVGQADPEAAILKQLASIRVEGSQL